MMKTGFDFTKSRIYKGPNYKTDYLYSIELPKIFTLFIESFEWDEARINNKSVWFIPYLEGGDIFLSKWDYQEIFTKPVDYNDDDELEDRGMLLIASSRGGIYLGTKGEDRDKIFTMTSSTEGSLTVIADTIFEFVRGLTDNIFEISDSADEYGGYLKKLGYDNQDIVLEIENWQKSKLNG